MAWHVTCRDSRTTVQLHHPATIDGVVQGPAHANVVERRTSDLEADLVRIGEDVEAIRPAPPPYQARAALAELLLLTFELRPRALKAHGDLAEESAGYLEHASAQLTELMQRALDELEGKSNEEVSARAVPEDPRRDRR